MGFMSSVTCKTCGGNISVSTGKREYGLAMKLSLDCANCKVVSSPWSSPRVEREQKMNPFVVMPSGGYRRTAPNDVFAEINIFASRIAYQNVAELRENEANPCCYLCSRKLDD